MFDKDNKNDTKYTPKESIRKDVERSKRKDLALLKSDIEKLKSDWEKLGCGALNTVETQ